MRKMTLGTKTFPGENLHQELFAGIGEPTHATTETDSWMMRLRKRMLPHHLTRMRENLQNPLDLEVGGAVVG